MSARRNVRPGPLLSVHHLSAELDWVPGEYTVDSAAAPHNGTVVVMQLGTLDNVVMVGLGGRTWSS